MKQGFTIVELLTTVTLLGLIMVAAVAVFTSILKSNQKTNAFIKVKQEGTYALNYLSSKIRNANDVECYPTPEDPNYIIVTNTDDSQITFITNSANQLVERIGATDNILASIPTKVIPTKTWTINCNTYGTVPRVVTFSFTLEEPTTGESQNFQTTVSLRNY